MKNAIVAGLAAAGLTLAAAVLGSSAAYGQETERRAEAFYQKRFCEGMRMEVRLGEQRRADCISNTHAIEVDWHDKWKEGIGQALAYSAETRLIPGLILVCRSDQAYCLASSLFVRQTLGHHSIEATLWDCLPIDMSLADCMRWDISAPAAN